MPDGAHDVRLVSVVIEGIAHGLAIDREALVLLAEGPIPLLQGTVEQGWIDTDQYITNDRLAGNQITSLFATTAKALARLNTQILSPSGDGLVAAHPAEDGPGGDGASTTASR